MVVILGVILGEFRILNFGKLSDFWIFYFGKLRYYYNNKRGYNPLLLMLLL